MPFVSSDEMMALSSESISTLIAVADAATWCCAIVLVSLIFLGSAGEDNIPAELADELVTGNQLLERPCDDMYVVGEGETLNTITEKCGDPYIVEKNPHIHDPDDVFPGLVIKLTPSKPRKSLT